MSDQKQESELGLFDIVNQFIEAANKLVNEDKQDVYMVSTAIRYAAAKYNSYEASLKSNDLAQDKKNALGWFTDDYSMMLTKNIDDMIDLNTEQKDAQNS